MIKDYIIVNYYGCISFLSKKTKELVQYLQNYIDFDNKNICIDGNDIYILKNSSNNISIIKLKLNDVCFIINEEYNSFKIENNKENDNDNDNDL